MRCIPTALLAASLFCGLALALAGCGGGGSGGAGGQTAAGLAARPVEFKAYLVETGTPGQPAALRVADVAELLLEVYLGADRTSGLRASTRIDLAGGATTGDLDLPGLTVGAYFVRLAALGSSAAMLAETGCTFPLAPGATLDLAVLVSPDGVRLSGPGGGCGPFPSLLVVDALTVTPGTMSAGGSVAIDVRVRNVGDVSALTVAPVLGFSRGSVDASADFDAVELVTNSSAATPHDVAAGASRTWQFGVTVRSGAGAGAVSIGCTARGGNTQPATGPSAPLTVISGSALALAGGLQAPATAARGTSFVASFTVANSGGAPAVVSRAQLGFNGSGLAVTARPGNPSHIAGSGTATFSYDVLVAPTAALGAISTNLGVTAADALSGVDASLQDGSFGSVTILLAKR